LCPRNLPDRALKAGRNITVAGNESAITTIPIEIVQFTDELWKWLNDQLTPFIFVSTEDGLLSVCAPFAKPFPTPGEKYYLAVPLWVEAELIGHIILHIERDCILTDEHIELMASVAKPFAIALANALTYKEVAYQRDLLIDDNHFLNREIFAYRGDGVIGGNSGLRNVMEMVQMVAPLNTTVLIMGETGTGKEVIANAIHADSARKDGPFIKINCGAIPENLIDDELFGHEKGAFTGAVADKRGRFERANGSTLFLDEIGEMPLQSQVRLLRVLQSKMVTRVGGDKTIPVDARVIAATNRNLKNMVDEKLFREDLWFRLNVFPIMVPPLRQRKEDIPVLIRYFITQKSREMGLVGLPSIVPGALERLREHPWPGNVRELENLVERELIWHRGGPLSLNSLFPEDVNREAVPTFEEPGSCSAPLSLDEAMCLHINKVLKITKGKINGHGGAAELLKINYSTLRARMSKLGIAYKK
jgi:hydrogenase-4 transcriptional activator